MSNFKLNSKRRALLELLLKEQGVEASSNQRIPRRQESDSIPLSFAQQRLWFLEQFDPGASAYNLTGAVLFKGQLNVAVLEQSFNAIAQRHEALRTNFTNVDGKLIQAIAPADACHLNLTIIDLTQLAPNEQQATIQRLAIEEDRQPFDLEKELLLRTKLLKLDAQQYVLLLTMHHIVSDGWSIGVLIKELAALYESFSTGKQSNLPELPIQYADFAIWQRQWLQGDVLNNQLSYWRQQLEGLPPLLELPTDRPRPAIQTSCGGTRSILLPQELTTALKKLSQQEDVTLFMTLLAAFKTLLCRYIGQTDIVVGSTIANRNRSEIEGLIGVFINTLVLRTNLSGNPSFRDLLRRVREVTLGAYNHQDLPFEKLVEELQPTRSLSRNPLFQVMFQLRNAPMPALEIPGLNLSLLEVERGTTQFDLSLDMEEVGERLKASIEYSTDLFDAATITRMLGHLQTILEGIVANPDQSISHLPLLTQVEQQQVLAWNDTKIAYPEVLIHQLFEQQVERTPDAIAVVYEDVETRYIASLTYIELNQKANSLAHYLQKLGVGADDLVGICVERSLDTIIGILGILKAGGAYLPLDPAYPRHRLALMLEDAQVPILITQKHLSEQLPQHQTSVVYLDAHWQLINQENQENPVVNSTAENLAYVIYTSGSTGKPKGVMIAHQSLANYVQAAVAEYGIGMCDSPAETRRERILQFASLSFDTSAEEIFPALTTGATLVLRTDEMLGAVSQFLQKCLDLQITVLDLPTAYWHELTHAIQQENLKLPPSIRLILIGGEKALPEKVAIWKKHIDNSVRLVNTYGPTEATIVSTKYELSPPEVVNTVNIPIGKPIANAQIYILDGNLQLVPIGVPGELYIGGAGLAKGYLNRPELTAEKFILNPYAHAEDSYPYSSEILYKTGDLVRYLPDGNIEYLGRIDNQVKIRGFRIELGEIEAAVLQYPEIKETVVLVWEDETSYKRLVAYIVPKVARDLNSSEIRSFLNAKLPEYMMPASFILLDKLPLTPNGKVDKQALPKPEDKLAPAVDLVPPKTTTEELLARIWSEVLRIERVGIHDNFFELGGDSILSIQIISKANQAGLQLTPKLLFQHQTIAKLAAVVGTNQTIQSEQNLIVGQVPLTPIQHWFFEEDFVDPHHWNQAVLLEVRQPLNLTLLQQAIQQLLLHHDALRLRFVQSESGWQQFNAEPDNVVPFTQIDLSALSVDEQKNAIASTASEIQASLNLAEGSIVRVALFDLGAQASRLLIVIHHLAVDGVSWRILISDLQTAYEQLNRGETIKLPAKTTSFKYLAERLVDYAQSPTLHSELNYWLALQKPVSCLPVDYPEGTNTVATAANVSVLLSQEETQALLQEVPKTYRTEINDVLLTALVQAFAQWTNNSKLLVDLEGHGREEIFDDVDSSRTVGWFTSVFPVLLQLTDAANPGETLKVVKEQLRSIPNRGIGYGILRYLSDIAQQLQTCPKAEVNFNYFGQFDQALPESSLFGLTQDPCGSAFSPKGNRSYLLEINGFVSGGKLQIDWTYSEEIYRRATVERLAESYLDKLRSLISHCQSPEAGGYTPSDFSEFQWSQWSQTDLDEILTAIGEV
ncbi:amino acid adenylation domain-containing protein [Microcoleus sp. FACHB-831]|uniref:non-ribosomal peptide synthetase n=1 Tax=Microcoleus sp. FACHB-831 TaxID=2692827 RepID=UPI001685C864|nr:non-ribosomal peptide synthetase [Microcoleus sp. FACHB-831]MBD1924287.1 amino acid adenylation domain-containing protein [Microcoleus sp. FACHB-831]